MNQKHGQRRNPEEETKKSKYILILGQRGKKDRRGGGPNGGYGAPTQEVAGAARNVTGKRVRQQKSIQKLPRGVTTI